MSKATKAQNKVAAKEGATVPQSVLDRFGGKAKDWHRHKDGGWVHKDAVFPNGEGAVRALSDAVLRGGEFRGGTFWGGMFRGGTFWGSTFWGGEFRGGEFWGGTFMGGEFRGGTFWGGTFWGGEFRGGTFCGGKFRGGTFNETPFVVLDRYVMTPSAPGYLTIGCETRTYAEWKKDGRKIASKHNELKWYKAVAEPLLPLLVKNGRAYFKGQKVVEL